MRLAILLAAMALPSPAQYTLYLCGAVTQEYVVGAKLPPSGLFFRSPAGDWRHAGYNDPFVFGLDYDPADPSTLYLAAGNGLIRASSYGDGHGEKWKILTGGEVTELRDIAFDSNAPGVIYFAYSHGIRATRDSGATWQDASAPLRRKYSEAVRVDRRRAGVLLAGGEDGVYRSPDGGKTWRQAGAAGLQIMRIEQSPHDACFWLAATQQGGLFASTDCGISFENAGRIGVGSNLYDIAFDPTGPKRIALAAWGPGVMVSEDGGKTWQLRNSGLPRREIWSVAFDPAQPGRLYAGINEEGLYVSEDAGRTWTPDGLRGATIYRMKFVPRAHMGSSR